MPSITFDDTLDVMKYGILEGGFNTWEYKRTLCHLFSGLQPHRHSPPSICLKPIKCLESLRLPGTVIMLVWLHEKSCQKGKRQAGPIYFSMSSAILKSFFLLACWRSFYQFGKVLPFLNSPNTPVKC